MEKPTSSARGQHGIALIAVLWLSVLLALIATAANRVSRTDVISAANMRSGFAAWTAVESAVDVALFIYLTETGEGWVADGTL